MKLPDKLGNRKANIMSGNFNKIKQNDYWRIIENILLLIVIIAISIPVFIILHRNLPNLEWKYELDRILLYVLILAILVVIVKFTRKIFVILCFSFTLFLLVQSLTGGYSFRSLNRDYQAMIHSMRDSHKPQKVFLNKIAFNSTDSKILKAVDYTNPEVRNFSLQATRKYFKEYQNDNRYRTIIQCLAVFREVCPNWNYVHDPKGFEYYAQASESVKTLAGDCDDYSILMAACIRVIGGTPRLVYTVNHIYPELYIGDEGDLETINYLIKHKFFPEESKGQSLYYHIDQDGKIWLNLDYTAKYPGGPYLNEEVLGIIDFD